MIARHKRSQTMQTRMTQKGKPEMTAPQSCMERRGQNHQISKGVKVRVLAQQEALERLISVLDATKEGVEHEPMPAHRWDDSLHRLSRLRMARALYALETTGEMVRVGPGAWIRKAKR
jgi:hypothetical protein